MEKNPLTLTTKGGEVASDASEVKNPVLYGAGVENVETANSLIPIGAPIMGVVSKGTTLSIKIGAQTSVEMIDVSDRAVCERVAKSYTKTQVLRAFGYNLFNGQKIPRLAIQHSGTSKRFAVPHVEEGQTEVGYMAANQEILKKMIVAVTDYVQSGQDCAKAIIESTIF